MLRGAPARRKADHSTPAVPAGTLTQFLTDKYGEPPYSIQASRVHIIDYEQSGPDVLDELRFFQRPSSKKQRVLLLDYDGTIAPFHRERFRAVPYPVVPHLLHRIMTMCRTRLIVIGGRSAREMAGLLGMNPAPEIWGVYGLQHLDMNGFHREAEVNPDSLQSLATAEAGLEREGLTDLLEIKMAGVAVHWRGLDPAEILKARRKAYTILEPLTSKRTGYWLNSTRALRFACVWRIKALH
jgi:hypothetical protein